MLDEFFVSFQCSSNSTDLADSIAEHFSLFDQVLMLWDRLWAFDSLELLAVLAAAVFCFRSDSVCACSSAVELADVFADLSTVRPVPLLQSFLFC
jgi:hypothetical protein